MEGAIEGDQENTTHQRIIASSVPRLPVTPGSIPVQMSPTYISQTLVKRITRIRGEKKKKDILHNDGFVQYWSKTRWSFSARSSIKKVEFQRVRTF